VVLAVRYGGQHRHAVLSSHSRSSVYTRLFSSSSFTPPEPPASKGIPVYANIDFRLAEYPASDSIKRNGDPNSVYVISGASRGIGLQVVKSLVERTKGSIVACCRSPETASGLNDYIGSLSESDGNRVHKVALDLEKQDTIESAAAAIKIQFDRVDVLLNVAGLLGDGSTTPGPERSISKLDRIWVERTMAVNVIGPVMLSKELAPLMKTKLRGKLKEGQVDRPVAIIASLSARVGSIADNELGGWISYRFSKSALNQATRTMAHELKRQGTWTVALHPGTTDTDLSKPFQGNVQDGRLFPVDFTVGRLLDVIDSMQEEHSGGFYDWAGKALPF
jgi:NAD(P)-dependent dehydrogenase (short-subunit alcohol dehydrogenase family)